MWMLSADEKKTQRTGKKFEDYVAQRSNFRLAWCKLLTVKQEPSETVDSFLKKVCILEKECKYTNPDKHIIDALIFGSNNPHVLSKLLEHNDTLTLDKAIINVARTQEATNNQLQDISGSQVTAVDALKYGPYTAQPSALGNQAKDKRCGNCGNFHDLTRGSWCSSYRTRCEACGKFNHWKSVCRSRYRVNQPAQEQSKDLPQKKKENNSHHWHS